MIFYCKAFEFLKSIENSERFGSFVQSKVKLYIVMLMLKNYQIFNRKEYSKLDGKNYCFDIWMLEKMIRFTRRLTSLKIF